MAYFMVQSWRLSRLVVKRNWPSAQKFTFKSGRSCAPAHFSTLNSSPKTNSKHLYEALQTPTTILTSVSYRPCMPDIIFIVMLSLGAKWKLCPLDAPIIYVISRRFLSSGMWWHVVWLIFKPSMNICFRLQLKN